MIRPEERPLLEFCERLAQPLLVVHHDWPVPRNRFLQGLAGDEQEAYSVGSRLHDDLVSPVEEHQRTIGRLFRRRRTRPTDAVGATSGPDALQNGPWPAKT
jgi:hypothetical protein